MDVSVRLPHGPILLKLLILLKKVNFAGPITRMLVWLGLRVSFNDRAVGRRSTDESYRSSALNNVPPFTIQENCVAIFLNDVWLGLLPGYKCVDIKRTHYKKFPLHNSTCWLIHE